MKNHKTEHNEFKKELLKNLETKKACDELEEEYSLIKEMIRARRNANMTQAKIAQAMKTTASAVSRIESLQKKQPPRLKH